MPEPMVTVTLNPLELKLLRRAIAKAVDDGLLDLNVGTKRICELDVLRHLAEEAGGNAKVAARVKRDHRQPGRRVA
jgi:hypothetical protein